MVRRSSAPLCWTYGSSFVLPEVRSPCNWMLDAVSVVPQRRSSAEHNQAHSWSALDPWGSLLKEAAAASSPDGMPVQN